ncbi:MAG: HD domain-containing phosphohydrolase [Candidatus Dormibacteria bacterium]
MRLPTGRAFMPVGYQVILPFLALSVLVGLLVSAVAGQQIAASATAELDGLAIKDGLTLSSVFANFEQRQLVDLRALTATDGVPSAVQASDTGSLRSLLWPLVLNRQTDEPLRASVIAADGREELSILSDPAHHHAPVFGGGRDLSGWPHVQDVLAGRIDQLGNKYVGVTQDLDGPVVYTVGPVVAGKKVVGAILAGLPLSALTDQIGRDGKFDVALYSRSGTQLTATSGMPSGLAPLDDVSRQQALTHGTQVRRTADVDGRNVSLYYVPWDLRGESAGYAAVVVPEGALSGAVERVRAVLVTIFLAALVLTFLTGLFVTRRITRPLSALVHATAEVAQGNLDHRAPVGSKDELGQLAQSFNRMTRSLQEKTQNLANSTEATLETLASAIDARDAYTHGHSRRVAAYSLELARAAGIEGELLDSIRRGCLVHDIGKIGVPDSILGKRGRLTAQEHDEMRRHPVLGHQMLRHLPWPSEVLDIVLHHHERWDGTGYPRRLAREDIPLVARLVSVADTLDAMTSHRPYRVAFTFDDAAREIVSGSGEQFDPAMVQAFQRVSTVLARMVQDLYLADQSASPGTLTERVAS